MEKLQKNQTAMILPKISAGFGTKNTMNIFWGFLYLTKSTVESLNF